MPTPVPTLLDQQKLRELLLFYLQRSLGWPGADSTTLEEVLRAYPALARLGRVPGREELLRCHPELAAAVQAVFVDDA